MNTVPLFPLPGVVLYPTMWLPLHVFEPRYRKMTSDALEGERLIGMAQLKPGWQGDYLGSPPIYPTLGVGQIIREEKHPNGSFDIVLRGVSRARILEETQPSEPYRIARVELLEDQVPKEQVMKQLEGQWAPLLEKLKLGPEVSIGTVLDLIAARYLSRAEHRQLILEELDILRRAKLLMDLLGGQRKWSLVKTGKPSPN